MRSSPRSLFRFRTLYQTIFGAIIVVALISQFLYGFMTESGHEVAYTELLFSYFTILSNIFVAVVLIMEARMSMRGIEPSVRFQRARGAAVFCILTTGLIYSLFLKGPGGQGQVQDSVPWINSVFHYIMPVAMALDWTIFPPKKPLPWLTILRWIGVTVVYFVYAEVLGFFSHVYPYFFLDPRKLHGYLGVLRASLGFIPFFLVFGAGVTLLSRIRPTLSFVYKKARG